MLFTDRANPLTVEISCPEHDASRATPQPNMPLILADDLVLLDALGQFVGVDWEFEPAVNLLIIEDPLLELVGVGWNGCL